MAAAGSLRPWTSPAMPPMPPAMPPMPPAMLPTRLATRLRPPPPPSTTVNQVQGRWLPPQPQLPPSHRRPPTEGSWTAVGSSLAPSAAAVAAAAAEAAQSAAAAAATDRPERPVESSDRGDSGSRDGSNTTRCDEERTTQHAPLRALPPGPQQRPTLPWHDRLLRQPAPLLPPPDQLRPPWLPGMRHAQPAQPRYVAHRHGMPSPRPPQSASQSAPAMPTPPHRAPHHAAPASPAGLSAVASRSCGNRQAMALCDEVEALVESSTTLEARRSRWGGVAIFFSATENAHKKETNESQSKSFEVPKERKRPRV